MHPVVVEGESHRANHVTIPMGEIEMSQNRTIAGCPDDLPEPLQKVVDGVSKAGEIGGTIGGGLLAIPVALGAKAVASINGKSTAEGDALAQRMLEGGMQIGRTVGKIAPLGVLAIPFLLARRLTRS